MAESVHELTSAVASGNPEAFARLYRAWFDHALLEARRCTGRDEQFCLDAVQETMLRVIRRMQPLDSEAALAAWIRAATRNACLDLLRQEHRRRRRERNHALEHREEMADGASLQREAAERLAWLREQLASIEPESVRALDLRYRLNWTLARIGQALNLKPGAVDGRISRTTAHLRAAAQQQEESHE